MDRNHLNNFERGSTKDHSCEIWSKSNQWFRRRCCLKIVNGRTDRRTTTTADGEWSQYLTLSLRLRWAKKYQSFFYLQSFIFWRWNVLYIRIDMFSQCFWDGGRNIDPTDSCSGRYWSIKLFLQPIKLREMYIMMCWKYLYIFYLWCLIWVKKRTLDICA